MCHALVRVLRSRTCSGRGQLAHACTCAHAQEKLHALLLEEGTDGVMQFLTVSLDPGMSTLSSSALAVPSPACAADWHALVLGDGKVKSCVKAYIGVHRSNTTAYIPGLTSRYAHKI
jgi:hypothetical protein